MAASSEDISTTDAEGAPNSSEWAGSSSDVRMLGVARGHYAELLLDAVGDALALFDDSDHLVCCNQAFLRLFEALDERAIIGRTPLDLLHAWLPHLELRDDAERERLMRLHTEPLAEGRVSFDVRTKAGRRLRVSDERSATNCRLRTIPEPARDGNAGDGRTLELVSLLSRKLLTPLNAMLGFAQLMQADRREPLSPRHRARLARISQGGEQLAQEIRELVKLADLGTHPASGSPEAVDSVAVLNEVIRALEPTASEAGTSLWLETPADEVPRVLVDQLGFTKILLTFGSNAVKYNRPQGAVRFVVSVPAGARLRVSVHDNGNGVPLELQAKLFRPREHADGDASQAEVGGTGLVLAKQLADLMDCAVGFKSTPGAGAEFWVEVPVA